MTYKSASKWRLLALHPYVLFLLVALAVWWPDGFNIGPVNDGWIRLGQGVEFVNSSSVRAFNIWPYTLSNFLMDSSFRSWQFVLFSLTLLRGIVWFEVIKLWLPGYRVFAVACGLIAMFHPFDSSFFWLGSMGADFAILLALVLCLASLWHLRSNSLASFLALFLLQFMSCFTYPGFLPLIIVFPALAWILRRIEGFQPPYIYLVKISVPVLFFTGLLLVLASRGSGRAGIVVDLNVHRTLAGYLAAARYVVDGFSSIFTSWPFSALLFAIAPASVALAIGITTVNVNGYSQTPRKSAVFYLILVVGLLVLAAVSYLPYAITVLRFGDSRQLLAAGIFIYTPLLLLPFVVLPKYLPSAYLSGAFLALFSVATAATGLEVRQQWVRGYRAEEALLAAVSTAIPNPAKGSTIVIALSSSDQAKMIDGFYNRYQAFGNAIRLIYGDATLDAGFIDTARSQMDFNADTLSINSRNHVNDMSDVPYNKLLLLGYNTDKTAQVLDSTWFARFKAVDSTLVTHKLGTFHMLPSPNATTCTLLEPQFRPAYCH